ncbi:MAG: FtsX-like permease family protein [Halioglobus sp.]
MSSLWFDLRYTLRLLARSPGFAALCVLVISLALALALTIYVLVRNQGLEPIPVPNGDRYVALQLVQKDTGALLRGDQVHADTLQRLKRNNTSFDHLGFARIHGSLVLNDGEITEAPWGTEIEPELLRLTGVKPYLGRLLVDADDVPGADPVLLVGYDLWQNYFSGREDIIGHRVHINSEPHTVVGVLPEGFRYPTDHHLWRAPRLQPNSPPGDHSNHFTPIGILKKGVSMDDASRDVAAILAQLSTEFPEHYENVTAKAVPYINAAAVSDFGVMNLVMMAAAFSILLLACLNVGNLLLVRANERSQELVVRSALGGSRARIIRQVMLESLIISLAGGVLGLWLGSYGAQFVQYQTEVVVGSTYLPFWMRFDISPDVYALTMACTLLIWALAGGVPAWRASNLETNTALSGSGKGVASKGSNKMARSLVGAEVVCSFFLLILSGAFVAAVNLASAMDFGVNTENTVSGLMQFDMQQYQEEAARYQFLQNLQHELKETPGIVAATFTTSLPGMGLWRTSFNIEHRDLRESGQWPMTQNIPIAVDYFQTLEVPLLEGRHFNSSDTADGLAVTIIGQQLAERYWPGESALGKRLQINAEGDDSARAQRWLTIVGVVSHIDQGQTFGRSKGLSSIYQPLAQHTAGFIYMVVRFDTVPKLYERTVQAALARVDRNLAVNMLRPIAESMSLNTRILQTLSELFVIVALVALVLAGTGIYGVVSRSVLLRTREMGIRRALGQTDGATVKVFLRQGGWYLWVGALVGGSGAVAASWLLTAQYPNLLDSMVSIVIIITSLMAVLVLGASYLPARKMTAMEPAAALHYE